MSESNDIVKYGETLKCFRRGYVKMKNKEDSQDRYFKHIEDTYCCNISDELFGKKYIIEEQFGTGTLLRMNIEDGIEISRLIINNKMEMDFDNREFKEDILEVGYCYRGNTEVSVESTNKKYTIKKGDIFVYKMLNDIDYFKFKYEKCKMISISMNIKAIKNSINPICEGQLIIDWQQNLNNIFKESILIIEESSYDMKRIANQIDLISIENMMGYMNLKIKTIEFLATIIEEKNNKNAYINLKNAEKERINKAKQIIGNNLENTPTVKELANKLNISVYKLQKGFNDITGNTVYEYIKKGRIEKAKYLLKNTNMSILEIANEIGYENPSKFAKLFKLYNNMTPLKYRKAQEKR